MMRRLILAVAILFSCAPSYAQTGAVLSSPIFTATLNSGAVCAGCLLDTFQAGTTTRLATYTDSALTTAQANPVVLDTAGRKVIYLGTSSYRFDLYTPAGVLIYSVDNVRSLTPFVNLDQSGTAGENLTAGSVVYLSDGSGSKTVGRWYLADADFTYASSTSAALGMVPSTILIGNTGTIRLQGTVTMPSASLTAGTTYYASATAGSLISTAPTNWRRVGMAVTTQTILLAIDQTTGVVTGSTWTLVSAGSAIVKIQSSSNSTPAVVDYGDSSTYGWEAGKDNSSGGNCAVAEAFYWYSFKATAGCRMSLSPAGVLTLSSDVALSVNGLVRRNTSDGSDSGFVEIAGGGATGESRGAYLRAYGNENGSLPGSIYGQLGNVASAVFRINKSDTNQALVVDGATGNIKLGTNVTDAVSTPTINGGFGTSPSIAGTAYAFLITVGTGGTSGSGQVAFGTTFSNPPICVATFDSTPVNNQILQVSASNAVLDFTSINTSTGVGVAFSAGEKIAVLCRGY